jgi:hypothetical protein
MEISSVVWLHIYPVFIGVCTVHSAQCTVQSKTDTVQSAQRRVRLTVLLCAVHCTHTNKDWLNIQPHDRTDFHNDIL